MIYDFVFYVWKYLRAALKIGFLICEHHGTTYFPFFYFVSFENGNSEKT